MTDLIERQVAINAINNLVNRFEQILRDIRESKEDDSVCGLCEYDGAYIGQSGDWCNECPGFDKADCFKLGDKSRKRWLKELNLPSAQPEPHYCRECKWSRCHINVDKYGNTETYWHCLNWDGGTDEEGYCYEWERRTDERA